MSFLLIFFLKLTSSQTESILSHFNGITPAQGIYWDIEALQDITITGIIINLHSCISGNIPLFEYYFYKSNTGTYFGIENYSTKWTLINPNNNIGKECFVGVSDLDTNILPIYIPANNRQGFMFYINNTVPLVRTTIYNNELLIIDNALPYLNILSGTIMDVGSDVFNRTTDNRGYAPAILMFYIVGSFAPSMVPTNVPTLNTMVPTVGPSMEPTSLPVFDIIANNAKMIKELYEKLAILDNEINNCDCDEYEIDNNDIFKNKINYHDKWKKSSTVNRGKFNQLFDDNDGFYWTTNVNENN